MSKFPGIKKEGEINDGNREHKGKEQEESNFLE